MLPPEVPPAQEVIVKRVRAFLPSFLPLVVLGILIIFALHSNSPRAQDTSSCQAGCGGGGEESKIAPRQLEFPYYSLREGFKSTVLLVSDSPHPLDFFMSVHSRSGQTLLAPAMTIQPQEKLAVDIASVVAGLGADITGDFAEGSVSIYFTGTIMPIAGQLTMTNPERRMVLQTELVDNAPGLGLLPRELNAVWWGLGGGRDARIAVTNTSGASATADLFLDFQAERHAIEPLVFVPHETKVLSIIELLGALKVSPAEAPEGGITIVPRGVTPALVAQGKITDPATGFSTTLNFLDPTLQHASALHASGLPIGLPSKDSPYVGAGVFIPHVIVRNLTDAPQSVTLTLEYPGEQGAQQTPLAPLPLGPYSTADFSLDSAFSVLPLPVPYCSIRIQYSGAPGSVIGEVASVDSRNDLIIDGRLANEGDGWAGSGAHPWHLDDETESILFLTNMSAQEAYIGFHVQAGGVHFYLTDLSLKAHETRAIDIRKLRDAQKADFKGNRIPAGATDGSVTWIRLSNLPVMGRLVEIQRHRGLASSYQCMDCLCPASYYPGQNYMTPSIASVLVQGTASMAFYAAYKNCNESYSYYNRTGWAAWSSQYTSIATVNSSGTITGQSGGSSSITAQYSDYKYTFNPIIFYCTQSTQAGNGNGTANVYNATMSSAKSVTDGVSASFSVTPSGGTPTSYAWSFNSPPGAGNNPNVTFTPNNTQSTSANGRWFALPNQTCTAELSAVYTIKSTVTFPGGVQKIPQTTLTVNLLTQAGFVAAPFVYGYPAYSYNGSQQLWVVTGDGSLQRSAPSKTVYFPASSQFYYKVDQHENKHVQQWGTGGINQDLYVVSGSATSLMNQLYPLTDATENGLKNKITDAWNAWAVSQQSIQQSRHTEVEAEAYAVSDPIAPQYRYQGSCGDTM